MKGKRSAFIYFWYQTDSRVPNTPVFIQPFPWHLHITITWTLKRHISIGVFVVYIDTGSPVLYIPSKSRDLADENNKILTEWKWLISIKVFYLYQRLQSRDNYFFKIKFVFSLFAAIRQIVGYRTPVCIQPLCTLTPEVQCFTFHRNHVIWQTKITKFWQNGNDSKQPYY
jgi:hypothetical protein